MPKLLAMKNGEGTGGGGGGRRAKKGRRKKAEERRKDEGRRKNKEGTSGKKHFQWCTKQGNKFSDAREGRKEKRKE